MAKAYVAQAAARSASKPLDQFLVEYETSILRRVESGELKSGSYKVIKETFVKLKTEFGNRMLSEISSTDIERWLDRMPVGMRTKKRHRAYALQIFNAARKQKLVSSNPVEDVGYKGRKNDAEEITVLTPGAAATVIRLRRSGDSSVIRYRCFCRRPVERNRAVELGGHKGKRNRHLRPNRKNSFPSHHSDSSRTSRFLNGAGELVRYFPASILLAVLAYAAGLLANPSGKKAGLHPWPRNACRHSFISYAFAIDHDENRIALESGNTPDVIHTSYRALVTREEAERFWNIRPLVNTPTNGTKNFGVSKPTKSKKTETTSPIAKKSKPVKKVESAKPTPEENFTKIIELHKAKGPVPFRPTQRDYKRQEKLVSVDSLSKITFDDGLFKDEADLNGFVRWILRCQAKREAGTFET